MRTLYLMRHAKSSWKDPELEDHGRPLNKRGERDVPIMGKRMSTYAVRPDRIITSDARRALDTALPVGTCLGMNAAAICREPRLYHASREEILSIIKELQDDWQRVMLVGHNPGLHDVVNFFYVPALPKFPTAAIVTLEFDIDAWRELDPRRVIYRDFDFPKKSPAASSRQK